MFQTTGAHCSVDKNAPPDAQEKNFIIRGSPEAVERAKGMILEKLGMQDGGYGGGKPSGGYGGGAAANWGGGETRNCCLMQILISVMANSGSV